MKPKPLADVRDRRAAVEFFVLDPNDHPYAVAWAATGEFSPADPNVEDTVVELAELLARVRQEGRDEAMGHSVKRGKLAGR